MPKELLTSNFRDQKSFQNEYNTLYLVSTPIGNLDDMSFRAVNTLKSVDIIFAEDTRVTKKLLNHFEINTKMDTYHEFNKEEKSKEIIVLLQQGKNVALVSDAGMPVISDPGYYIVREVYKTENNVVIIPGANAALSALCVSSLTPSPFTFYGFLPSKQSQKKKMLEGILNETHTGIIYESPHKIIATLNIIKLIDSQRKIVIAREITKKYEEIISGTVDEILSKFDAFKGEIVLLISGRSIEENSLLELNPKKHVEYYVSLGYPQKDAIKMVAKERNVPKNDIYKLFI